jgi:gamma-glutamylcyclotransferase (GGCT)/AIG2-like uncharacterized protein YtfP
MVMDLPPSQRPSKIVRKFLRSGTAWDAEPNANLSGFSKEIYFFYGSLMDPSTLTKVLDLKDRPSLHPAWITGYRCMLWGPYPALIDGPQGMDVRGVVYELQSPEEERRLQEYESDNYRVAGCLIKLDDGSGRRVSGQTFKWDGDPAVLREGHFDMKDWQLDSLERNG